MSPATHDELQKRYAELDALIERALEACAAKDRDQAVLLSYAVTQKLTTLDERLLDLGIIPEAP
jgi:hypothetical protein